MANIKVVLNNKGFREIRNSSKVVQDLQERAERIASAANQGGGEHKVLPPETHGERARVAVVTADFEAIKDEYRNNNLTRSFQNGRG